MKATTLLAAPDSGGGGDWKHITLNWTPSAGLTSTMQIIGVVLLVIWLIYLLAQFAIPSKRGGGGKMQGGKLIGAAIVILFCLNFSMFPTALEYVANFGVDVANTVRNLKA